MTVSRRLIWLTALALAVAVVLFFTIGHESSDRPGVASPHAIDQNQ